MSTALKTVSLTATGSADLPQPTTDTLTQVQISGTYGTVTFVIEGSIDGGTKYDAVVAARVDTGAVVTGTLSPSDNAIQLWKVPSEGLTNVRARVTAIASGTAVFTLQSGAYVGVPFVTQQGSLATSVALAQAITSVSANALTVGPAGTTNPSFNVDASTSSAATGINIKSAASGAGVALAATTSGTNDNLTIDAVGSGTLTLQGTATGAVLVNQNLTLADAKNVVVNTTTGTKIGTGTTQKIGLWNATPIVQPANSVDYLAGLVNVGLRASGGTAAAAFPGLVTTSSTSGMGYATGAGTAVTQITSRTTGVTANSACGAITLFSAAGSATPATFTVTNSSVAATDVVHVCQKSGTDVYEIFVTNVAAGSFKITSLTTGGTTTEQPVFSFAVIKAVAA